LSITAIKPFVRVTFSFFGSSASGTMRTQVAIIGGGPAGLLLAHILHRNGIVGHREHTSRCCKGILTVLVFL
jgi:NADPH-dependent 2,4-dienoyl-CoA reductase/sulfur reductase-like enzyme